MAQRVLVINDTQEILDIFRLLLEEEGYEVVLYSYAVMDMREILRHAPDLIILDYIFGTETVGWQMLQKIKMTRETATIPLIICTAAIREVREIEGYLRAHGVTLVPKPFDIDDFLAAVKQALNVTPTHDAKLLPQQGPTQEAEASRDGLEQADKHHT